MSEVKLQDYNSCFESRVYEGCDKKKMCLLQYSIPQGSRALKLLLAFNKIRICIRCSESPIDTYIGVCQNPFFLVPVPPVQYKSSSTDDLTFYTGRKFSLINIYLTLVFAK